MSLVATEGEETTTEVAPDEAETGLADEGTTSVELAAPVDDTEEVALVNNDDNVDADKLTPAVWVSEIVDHAREC